MYSDKKIITRKKARRKLIKSCSDHKTLATHHSISKTRGKRLDKHWVNLLKRVITMVQPSNSILNQYNWLNIEPPALDKANDSPSKYTSWKVVISGLTTLKRNKKIKNTITEAKR